MQAKNIYHMPVPRESVGLVVRDNPSHQGSYEGSIDLAVPVDTPVFASAAGEVVRVKDDSVRYGNDKKYGQDVNYISLLHDEDEISEYLHLAPSSALVKVGDKVKVGQQLARTGLSGWLTDPHLHFMVYAKTTNKKDFQCMEVSLV